MAGRQAALLMIAVAGTAALSTNQIKSGDVINIKVTTSVGTFGQSQFTVP